MRRADLARFRLQGRLELGSDPVMAARTQQYQAAEALLLRLYHLGMPGCILGDEVGLGKTYVALGVAAWVLAQEPQSRVLILTSSRSMVDAWATRWQAIKPGHGPDALHGWVRRSEQARSWQGLIEACAGNSRMVITSYDALRGRNTQRERFRHGLAAALIRLGSGRSLWGKTVRTLASELGIDTRVRAERVAISRSKARAFWKAYANPERGCWRRGADDAFDDLEAESRSRHIPAGFDLVIVDEAHRLRSPGRRQTLEPILARSAKRLLHLTATPFSLDIAQFEVLLRQLTLPAGRDRDRWLRTVEAIDLEGYRRRLLEVGHIDADWLASFTTRLRPWIVRRTWDGIGSDPRLPKAVDTVTWDLDLDGQDQESSARFATIALERSIASVLADHEQTHIASRRTSLCSSWPAARHSLETHPLPGDDPGIVSLTRATCRLIGDQHGPKIELLAQRIAQEVRGTPKRPGCKIVVFAERSQTLRALQTELSRVLRDCISVDRQERKRLLRSSQRRGAGLDRDERFTAVCLASLRARGFGAQAAEAYYKAWRQRLEHEGLSPLDFADAHRTGAPLAILDGTHGEVEQLCRRFQTPARPWVLLCGRKAQESIDLHRDCTTVVLADPVWSPADREQRIGRVRRIGSPAQRIRCIDVYTRGTYEEQIIRRCQYRGRLLQSLLGAQDIMLDNGDVEGRIAIVPEQYRLKLAPSNDLYQELQGIH